jgi:YegS/Rv2252/BmrU family lipid kinase
LCQLDEEKVNIIILGGDGTINEVVNGITDFSKVRLGVVPTGTGNDFARNLGIKGAAEDIIHDILKCEKGIKIDLGVISWDKQRKRRLFCISSGIGFDALVCKYAMTSRVKKVLNSIKMGKLAYLILTIRSLFAIKTFDAKISFGNSEDKKFKDVIFAVGMNLRAEGGGVPMAPSSDPCDGLLPFCVAADIPKWILPYCLIRLVLGKHESLKYFHIHNEVSCHIQTDSQIVLHADGEYLGDVSEVWYECLPQHLEVLNVIKNI